jgi:hypothetical protein
LEISIAVIAVVIATGSMIFAGLQTRILARQAAELTSTSQVSYNLQVLVRLEEILFQIGDDPASHAYAWGPGSITNQRPELAVEALLDVVVAAKAALVRLPGPARKDWVEYEAAWDSYINYIVNNSPGVRARLLVHPDWWPELASFVRTISDEQQDKSEPVAPSTPSG